MDGSDGMYAVKLTSFGALEFVANENTLGNEHVCNKLTNLVNVFETINKNKTGEVELAIRLRLRVKYFFYFNKLTFRI